MECFFLASQNKYPLLFTLSLYCILGWGVPGYSEYLSCCREVDYNMTVAGKHASEQGQLLPLRSAEYPAGELSFLEKGTNYQNYQKVQICQYGQSKKKLRWGFLLFGHTEPEYSLYFGLSLLLRRFCRPFLQAHTAFVKHSNFFGQPEVRFSGYFFMRSGSAIFIAMIFAHTI